MVACPSYNIISVYARSRVQQQETRSLARVCAPKTPSDEAGSSETFQKGSYAEPPLAWWDHPSWQGHLSSYRSTQIKKSVGCASTWEDSALGFWRVSGRTWGPSLLRSTLGCAWLFASKQILSFGNPRMTSWKMQMPTRRAPSCGQDILSERIRSQTVWSR